MISDKYNATTKAVGATIATKYVPVGETLYVGAANFNSVLKLTATSPVFTEWTQVVAPTQTQKGGWSVKAGKTTNAAAEIVIDKKLALSATITKTSTAGSTDDATITIANCVGLSGTPVVSWKDFVGDEELTDLTPTGVVSAAGDTITVTLKGAGTILADKEGTLVVTVNGLTCEYELTTT